MIRFLLLTVLLTSPLLSQQKTTAINVLVEHTGDDPVGVSLAYEVREEIRRSTAFKLGETSDYDFTIILVSLDPDRDRGNRTAVAVIYQKYNDLPYREGDSQTWLPFFLHSQVMIVGSERARENARIIVASLDREIEKLKMAEAASRQR